MLKVSDYTAFNMGFRKEVRRNYELVGWLDKDGNWHLAQKTPSHLMMTKIRAYRYWRHKFHNCPLDDLPKLISDAILGIENWCY